MWLVHPTLTLKEVELTANTVSAVLALAKK